MANFRTIGWFANRCFQSTNNAQYSPIFDFTTGQDSQTFPLEIATKIYWETSTIDVTASITSNSDLPPPFAPTGTSTHSLSTNWGDKGIETKSINYQTGESTISSSITSDLQNAKNAICKLQTGNHTNVQYQFLYFNRGDYDIDQGGIFEIRIFSDPPFNPSTKTLHSPLSVNFIAQGAGIAVSPFNFIVGQFPQRPVSVIGTCSIFTPWGNINAPLIGTDSVSINLNSSPIVSASMTVTINDANPDVRYA